MAWTGLKNLMYSPHAHGSAGGSTKAQKARWLVLALAGGLSAGGAWAASDLLLAQHVVSPDPVPAGGVATITMTINNNGTDAASNVKLTDTIPAGSIFVSMVASNGGTCTGSGPYACTWGSIP